MTIFMQHCEPGNFGVDAVQKGFGQRPVLGKMNPQMCAVLKNMFVHALIHIF